MNRRKAIIRRGLTGGGVATLLLAASFVAALGVPTTPSLLLLVSWLGVVGSTMVVAGRRERVSIGSTTLGWPRVAAIAIALLAVGWAAVSVAGLLAGETITGLGPLGPFFSRSAWSVTSRGSPASAAGRRCVHRRRDVRRRLRRPPVPVYIGAPVWRVAGAPELTKSRPSDTVPR